MIILAIDPGTTESAWVKFVLNVYPGRIDRHGFEPNFMLLDNLEKYSIGCSYIVCEEIACYGMAVGKEVLDTVRFTGRLEERSLVISVPFRLMPRREVKMHLCHSMQAKDANIRQALIDKFGGKSAQGTKEAPGPLYGISSHRWSALAIAVTAAEKGNA